MRMSATLTQVVATLAALVLTGAAEVTAASAANGSTAPRTSVATVNSEIKGKSAIIKIAAPKGTHLNYDGPWKLTVTGSVPLADEDGVFAVDAFDKKAESFTLPLKDQPVQGQSDFKLAYFLCSDDNVWCKRIETTGVLK
jgi:hypothetical protein